MRARIFLLLAIVLAMVTAYSVYTYLETVQKKALQVKDLQTVYIANRDIPQGTRIVSDMISKEQIPQAYIHSKALKSKKKSSGA